MLHITMILEEKKGQWYIICGSHSKNNVKKIKNIDLKYVKGEVYSEEDRKILQDVIEAHEGKDKNMEKICKKYKISQENVEYTMQLIKIIKDADALDRVRLDINFPTRVHTDLDPRYLRTNGAKQLLNLSYQLESLTKKVSFDRILAYKTEEQKEGGIIQTKRDKFVEDLKRGIVKVPQTVQKIKKTLGLSKKKIKLVGKNTRDKIGKLIDKRKEQKIN